MKPFTPAPIERREDFGVLLNQRGLLGCAIEIGTDKAVFAAELLRRWDGQLLICIDPWADALPGYDDVLSGGRPRQPDLLIACAVLARWHDRVQVLQMTSEQALRHPQVAEYAGRVSFIYIDGDHRYEAVRQDIAGYWPLVAPSGLLAGHDYNLAGVQQAVHEFADPRKLTVYAMSGAAWSWYVAKPPEACA